MNIEQRTQGTASIITVAGKIDANTSSEFESTLMSTLDQGRSRVLIDCTQLEFISSAGLRVLLMAGKRLKAAQGMLGIVGLIAPIREVFDISGFSNLFNMYDTVETALKEENPA